MQVSSVLMSLLKDYWYIVIIFIFLSMLNTPWFKGVLGEFKVNLLCKIYLDKDVYHLLKNITLPTDDGTTQIDHIIVSKYGLFVVETKNMKGWIFGKSNQKIWTQKIYKHSSQFQNPLYQNYKHVKTIETFLGLEPQQLHSVVVFIGNSIFKTKMPANVTQGMGFIRYIQSKQDIAISDAKLNSIIDAIKQGKLSPSIKTHREHIKHVKQIVEKKQNTNAPICPKCGNTMILRQAKKGKNVGVTFWGCANFPKCRGTLKYH